MQFDRLDKIQCSGRNKNGARCNNWRKPNEDELFFCHLHKNQNKEKIDDELSNDKIEEKKQPEIKKVTSLIRFFHFIIDFIVWLLIVHILTFRLKNPQGVIAYVIIYAIYFFSFICYFYILEVCFQKTVAKFITKSKVVTNNGNKPKKTAILIRTICRLIPFDRVSFLFTRNGFHDRLSHTMVIKPYYCKLPKKQNNVITTDEDQTKKRNISYFKKNAMTIITFIIGIFVTVYTGINLYPSIEKRFETQRTESRANTFFIGVKFLENDDEDTRIRGAKNLYKLANNSFDYQVDVCNILCEQFRKITSNPAYQRTYKEKPSDEIQNIIDLLFQSHWIYNIFDQYDKNLTGTYLSGANFYRKKLKNVDFSNAKLREVNFADAELNNVNFNNAELQNINFKSKAGYQFSDMHTNNYQNTRLSDIYFLEAKLDNVDFSDAILNAVDFESAKLINVNLRNYMSNSSPSDYKRFSDVNFRGTVLEGYGYNKITENRFTLELTRENKQETKESKK